MIYRYPKSNKVICTISKRYLKTLSFQIIDLFAGAGGLSSGLIAQNNEVACAVELNADAIESYRVHLIRHQLHESTPFENSKRGSGIRVKDSFKEANSWKQVSRVAHQAKLGDTPVSEILAHTSLKTDKMTMLVGGPPCQAYSLAGRVKNKSNKDYVPELDERHFLYKAYLDFILRLNPEAFVLENVKGMASSRVDGKKVFGQILQDLADPNFAVTGKRGGCEQRYKIFAMGNPENPFIAGMDPEIFPADHFLIRAEQYGLPQTRHRIFLIGIREDLDFAPIKPDFVEPAVSAGSVIEDLPALRSKLSKNDSFKDWKSHLLTSLKQLEKTALRRQHFNLKEALSRAQEDIFTTTELVDLNEFAITNHNCRRHMPTDIARYALLSASSSLSDIPHSEILDLYGLAPNHKNWKSGHFTDRFKVVKKSRPSGTITSHIAKDGHYFIHPSASQARSLSVREAARIQTFTDDHVFLGTVTSQYTQVGNAVPPALAKLIGSFISNGLSRGNKNEKQ